MIRLSATGEKRSSHKSVVKQSCETTVIFDRGSDFACWGEIEKAPSCDMYFAGKFGGLFQSDDHSEEIAGKK